MPYQDVKILDFKNMEVKGNFNINMMYCYIMENPNSFQARSWGESEGFVCGSKGLITQIGE